MPTLLFGRFHFDITLIMLIAVGRADNAKLHHVLEFGLSNALLRWVEATIPLEGCWTSRSDVMDNIVCWRNMGAGEVRKIGILP